MRMKLNQAVMDSLRHWFRMRRWVRRQNQNNAPSFLTMGTEINEIWGRINCALCLKYDCYVPECKECPLFKNRMWCSDDASPWSKVESSKTWGEWIENSNAMIRALWKVRYSE